MHDGIPYRIELPASELESALQTALAELAAGKALAREATTQGLRLDLVPNLQKAVTIKVVASGLTSSEILVILSPVATEVVQDLWRLIVLPWLQRKLGSNTIVPR